MKKFWWAFVIVLILVLIYILGDFDIFNKSLKSNSKKILDDKEKKISNKITELKNKNEDYSQDIEILEKEIDEIKENKKTIDSAKFDNSKDAYEYIQKVVLK